MTTRSKRDTAKRATRNAQSLADDARRDSPLTAESVTEVTPKPRRRNPAVRNRDGEGSPFGNGKRYTADDKLRAVSAMLAQNREHPFSDASLAAARAAMGFDVPVSTLRQWNIAYHDKALSLLPAVNERAIVETTYNNLATSLVTLQTKLLTRATADDKINEAGLRDLVVSLGIVIDKMKAMIGLPTSTVLLNQQLSALCVRMGIPIDDVLSDVIAEARRRLDDEAAARRAKMLPGGEAAQIVDGDSDVT